MYGEPSFILKFLEIEPLTRVLYAKKSFGFHDTVLILGFAPIQSPRFVHAWNAVIFIACFSLKLTKTTLHGKNSIRLPKILDCFQDIAVVLVYMGVSLIISYHDVKGLTTGECENCAVKLISILIAVGVLALTLILTGCTGICGDRKGVLRWVTTRS